jgi:diacylglycerol kinase (ATP)
VAAIVNPAAGNRRAMARWQAVSRHLLAGGYGASVFQTKERGDAATLARQAVEMGFETVVAVGGDGTVNEVVNGMLQVADARGTVRLGIVPAGTGMDFVRNARLPRRPRSIAAAVMSTHERRLDIGMSEADQSRAFVNFAETGLGAAVVAREARMSEAWPGRLSFFLAALAASVQDRNVAATISVDGAEVYDGRLVSVVIANGEYFGGGMRIAPQASMEDGKLDVLVLGDFRRAELISQIWKLYPGSHVAHPKVLWTTGTSITVTPHAPTRLDLDGELFGEGPYTFHVVSQELRVCASPPE